MIERELINILVCPACRGDVIEKEEEIICQKCALRYPIKDGIPVMLIEEAKK